MSRTFQKIFSFWPARPNYHIDQGKQFDHKKLYLFGGLAFYILLMLARSWPNLSLPGLYVEDASHYFNLFYGNNKSVAAVFQNPNGYYNILNNLVAFLTAKADILIQPLIYQVMAISLCVIAVAAVSFSGLIQNRFVLLVGPLLLGLSGMNHIYYYMTLTFQMYLVVLILLVLLLWQQSRFFIVNILFVTILSILVWSGPYSVLAVPFSLAFILFFKGKTWMLSTVIVVTLAYALSVEESTIMLQNIFDTKILYLWFSTMITDVFFMGMKDSFNTEKILLLLVIFVPLLVYLRKERFYLKITALLFVIIISSFAPLFLSKKYLLYQTIYPCHILIAQFFYLIFILYTADKLISKMSRYELEAGLFFILATFSFILLDNLQNPDKWSTEKMDNIPAFLQAVKEAEGLGLKERGEQMVIFTDGIRGTFRPVAIVGDRSKDAKLVARKQITVKD